MQPFSPKHISPFTYRESIERRETNRRGRRRTISSVSRHQGSSVRRETVRQREERKKRKKERKKERKRGVCTRACALWSPVGLPFNRWLDSPTHSFIHTRCTRFESISKPRKRIFPIGLATAASTRNSSRSPPSLSTFQSGTTFRTKTIRKYLLTRRFPAKGNILFFFSYAFLKKKTDVLCSSKRYLISKVIDSIL